MRLLYWKLRIFILALRWIPQINLFDNIIYAGEICTVINGVIAGKWTIKLPSGEIKDVDRRLCKKVWTWCNIRRSFTSGYRFYTGSWLSIWYRKGIESWVKKCRIWPWPVKKQ